MKTSLIDLALEDVDGVVRWYEYIRGEVVSCMFDARHLARVLEARKDPSLEWSAAGGGSLKDRPMTLPAQGV